VKILFDHPNPFFLAHGGFQVQIEQTKAALEQIGLEVEYLRWWDERQTGDIIHYFGRPSGSYVDFAHQKKLKVVVAELHTGLGSRSTKARAVQKAIMTLSQKLLPSSFTARMSWDSYRKGDAFVALTSWEAHLMREMFGATSEHIHVIPNGVEEVFFTQAQDTPRSEFLVCTATITERKRVLEPAQAAVQAKTPVWIIGRPYSENDPYYQRFLTVQSCNSKYVRYEGGISSRDRLAQIYSTARGFVLLSSMESLSLSSLEAAACGCPLLLADLPWARSSFLNNAAYCPIGNPGMEAETLERFYHNAPSLPPPNPPMTWKDVAHKLASLYHGLLR